jgi:hypothetical protein
MKRKSFLINYSDVVPINNNQNYSDLKIVLKIATIAIKELKFLKVLKINLLQSIKMNKP